jgi:hypothetical protein
MQCVAPSRVIIEEFFAVLVVKRVTIRNVEYIVGHRAQHPLVARVPKIQRKPNEVPVPAPRVLTALSHGFRLPMCDANSGCAPARAKIDIFDFAHDRLLRSIRSNSRARRISGVKEGPSAITPNVISSRVL